MSGKEELNAVLAEIATAANDNPCAMNDGVMGSLAAALRNVAHVAHRAAPGGIYPAASVYAYVVHAAVA